MVLLGNQLAIGRIPFLVCAPFFHRTLGEFQGFIDGPPSLLNTLLAKGQIHLAPSSSIEYAMHPGTYLLDPRHCTAGTLEIRSVRLFSQVPLQELDGKSVCPSQDSATSNALARVLLHRRFGVHPCWTDPGTPEPVACVHIGDTALREGLSHRWAFSYDLGTLWHAWQGHPFVFGAWMVRRDAVESPALGAQVHAFLGGLADSIRTFRENPERALAPWLARFPAGVPIDEILSYFRIVDYRFGAGHKESLARFYALCAEEGLIPMAPPLEFLDVPT